MPRVFNNVKYALTHAPVLALPTFNEPFEVVCGASIVGIGVILLQKRRSIAFESGKFCPAKNSYTTEEQELIAVVYALRSWCCYSEGADCMVVTDHDPLTYSKS